LIAEQSDLFLDGLFSLVGIERVASQNPPKSTPILFDPPEEGINQTSPKK
jgi:hypothetical protein